MFRMLNVLGKEMWSEWKIYLIEEKPIPNFIAMSTILDKNRKETSLRQNVKINLIKSKLIAKLNRMLFV